MRRSNAEILSWNMSDQYVVMQHLMGRFADHDQALVWYRTFKIPGYSGLTAELLVLEGRCSEVLQYLEAVDAGIYS